MDKFFKWVIENKGKVFGILIFVIIGVPISINIAYFLGNRFGGVIVYFSAGELLSFYGSLLAFIGSISIGAIALWQTDNIRKKEEEYRKEEEEYRKETEYKEYMPNFSYELKRTKNDQNIYFSISQAQNVNVKAVEFVKGIDSSSNNLYVSVNKKVLRDFSGAMIFTLKNENIDEVIFLILKLTTGNNHEYYYKFEVTPNKSSQKAKPVDVTKEFTKIKTES